MSHNERCHAATVPPNRGLVRCDLYDGHAGPHMVKGRTSSRAAWTWTDAKRKVRAVRLGGPRPRWHGRVTFHAPIPRPDRRRY